MEFEPIRSQTAPTLVAPYVAAAAAQVLRGHGLDATFLSVIDEAVLQLSAERAALDGKAVATDDAQAAALGGALTQSTLKFADLTLEAARDRQRTGPLGVAESVEVLDRVIANLRGLASSSAEDATAVSEIFGALVDRLSGRSALADIA